MISRDLTVGGDPRGALPLGAVTGAKAPTAAPKVFRPAKASLASVKATLADTKASASLARAPALRKGTAQRHEGEGCADEKL